MEVEQRQDELEKLLKRGEGWLAAHPRRDAIVRRYLKFRPTLARQAIHRLVEQYDQPAEEFLNEVNDTRAESCEESLERPLSLNDERLRVVAAALVASGAKRVLDYRSVPAEERAAAIRAMAGG